MRPTRRKSKPSIRGNIDRCTPSGCAQAGWREFVTLLGSTPRPRFTLVIGAGIHQIPQWECPIAYESGALLGSWNSMLDSVVPKVPGSPCASLRWDLGVLSGHSDKPAQERSARAHQTLCQSVLFAESAVLSKRCSYEPLTSVMRAECVSNIVSLNFDLTIERLLLGSVAELPKPIGKTMIERRVEIGNCVIWHPHGDRRVSRGSCLGLREYALSSIAVESARSTFKQAERQRSTRRSSPRTWIDLMMSSHLIFLGTSIDFSEWDIWFSLVNRWRNFAKRANRKHQPSTFVLTTGTQHAHLPDQFTRLTAPNWGEGWKWLGAAMNRPHLPWLERKTDTLGKAM